MIEVAKDFVLEDVGTRLATLARVKNKPELAIDDEADEKLVTTFYDAARTRVLTDANIIKSPDLEDIGEEGLDEASAVDPPDDPDPELIPSVLWTAISYWIMREWFITVGEPQLSTFYENAYKSELSQYRFGLFSPKTASRPYRGI